MRPSLGGRNPEMIENRVVLPAPFGPISAVMHPGIAANDALFTASRPPKRLETFSTWSRASATIRLRERRLSEELAMQAGEDAGDALRREGDDKDQHAAVDDQIETRRAAGQELGQFAERLDHQCA